MQRDGEDRESKIRVRLATIGREEQQIDGATVGAVRLVHPLQGQRQECELE
jgi:hypothetical protein